MNNSCEMPGMIPVEQALQTMLSHIGTYTSTEPVSLDLALGRVLGQDIQSLVDVPPADNSAMDGYAFAHSDLANNQHLTLAGTALAGVPFVGKIEPGQCVRIMTGAIMPLGTDTVVMQENTSQQGETISFLEQPYQGNSVRRAGEDIRKDDLIVKAGSQLTPALIALIASIGVGEVTVYKKITVGIIATGDELVSPGQPLKAGQIYESNRYALFGLLHELPVKVIDYGIVKDHKPDLQHVFTQADNECDLVLSCGGVSVGDADYVKDILDDLGQINFWKVAIKPGKPFAFGQLKKAWFCGLPGNPVSSYVTFSQLVKPLICALSQFTPPTPLQIAALAGAPIRKRPGRADYQRGIYYQDDSGQFWVKPNGKQGSGIMSSIANANCYIVLPIEQSNLAMGEQVTIQPF